MSTGQELYRLDEVRVAEEYVEGLFSQLRTFLLCKHAGHCQRVDYLPLAVLELLGERLIWDEELKAQGVVCRVISSETDGLKLKPWEVTGSGAVALREDATYGRVKVFCALFPAGIRLAEEDSLNVATFKTDDAESFDIRKSLKEHLFALVAALPSEEAIILKSILNSDAVRPRNVVEKLRYVLSVIGERDRSEQPVTWEVAGAYLYEVHLIPDFGLTEQAVSLQLERNAACTKILLDGEKDLSANILRLAEDQGLLDEEIRRNLAVILTGEAILKPDTWLPPICHDPVIRDKLSFDAWDFKNTIIDLKVELKPLQDPKNPNKIAKGLALKGGSLANDGVKPIQISWTVSPQSPPELAGFRVTVIRIAEDGAEADVIAPQSIGAKRKSFMVPIADNNLDADEKCIARIRIQCLAKGGTPILNAVDVSEDFWIENGEEFAPPPVDKGTRLRHLDELSFMATYASGKVHEVRNRGWDPARSHIYVARLTNNDRGDLVFNPLLLGLEREILRNPETLGILEANLVNRRVGELVDFKPLKLAPIVNQIANNFYKTRSALFGVIADGEEGTGVVAIADLHLHGEKVLTYVQSYLDLVNELSARIENASGPGGINSVLHDLAPIMRIDTVLMRVGPSDAPIETLLFSPTHPLRILWLYQFESFVRRWIDQMKGRSAAEIKQLIASDSLDKLANLNIPNALAWNQQNIFVNTDSVDFFWSIFPHANSKDLRTAVNATLQVLGGVRREVMTSTVTPRQISSKIERYLCHHPYVSTLKINVINPGDAQLLLEAVKLLLELPLYRKMNFDIKFFAPKGTRHQLIANAFDSLMEQRDDEEIARSRGISDTEEALLQPNTNPLFPKLIYAKHVIDELLENTDSTFEAHLTFIIDYFGTTVATRHHDGFQTSSSLYNLLAEYVTDYTAGSTTATWSRMIAPNQCPSLLIDGATESLFGAHDGLSHLTACFFDWGKSLDRYATVQLELTDENGKHHLKTLRKIHEGSDWVFTIDRNFGIEYYDNPVQGEASGYLIDYTPEFLDSVSHRLIISTHHRHEIESILRGGFSALLNPTGEEETEAVSSYTVARVLQVLKSVSGKLALKLINNPAQAQEVIGLALTRLALEKDGRLEGRVLIPVDSHIALFHQTPKELENSELTLKRTDLMLVDLRGRKLHIDFIEVKNRKYTSPQALIALQSEIREKNKSTEAHFRAHFLGTDKNKRFDSEIKNKELANILLFYFERARRYGLFEAKDGQLNSIDVDADKGLEKFYRGLEAVATGLCEMSFGHEGVIINGSAEFEFDQKVVHDNNIQVVGRKGIAKLLDLVLEDDEPAGGEEHLQPMPKSTRSMFEFGVGAQEGVGGEGVRGDVSSATMQSEEQAAVSEVLELIQTSPPSGSLQSLPESPHIPEAQVDIVHSMESIKIHLGRNLTTGGDALWDPYTAVPQRLTNQHVLIVGKSGSGKSETTKAMIWELAERGIPTVIFDFQGEYAEGDFYEATHPQVFDVMDGLPINPFELPVDPLTKKRKSPLEMVFRLADTLNTVFAGSGDIQLGILREAIEECYVQQGFNLQDSATWSHEPPTLDMLAAVLNSWIVDRGAQVKNLQVRLQPLFKSGIFRQGKAGFGFDDLFKRTTVLKMTSGIKDLMLAASQFMLEKIYATMLAAGPSKTLRAMVCVDEAHKLCGDETVTMLIKEARKYGLGVILSSQETRDFHPSIFANTGTLIALALEDADATVMARNLGLVDKSAQKAAKELILNQANGRALVRSQHFLPYAEIQIESFEERIKNSRHH
ncbi:MAG: ATP-binding protein [Herbaspirillum sp.]|nr:ATP-binding protein [Herbaspirillum sp.]